MDQGDEDSQIIAALVEQRDRPPSLAATLVAKMRERHAKVAADREKIMIFIISRVIKGEGDPKIIAALTEQWDVPSPMAAILIMLARKKYAEVEKKIMKRSCIASCNRWKVCDYMQDYLALPGVVKFGFVASETQTMHLD